MVARILALLAIGAVAVTPLHAQSAKTALVLKPSTPWHVDYAEDRCRLMREFGSGDTQVFAIFDRYGPGDRFRMTLAGKPVKYGSEAKAALRFGPSEAEQKQQFYSGNLGELPAMVFQSQFRVAPPTPQEQPAIDRKRPGDDWIELAPIAAERAAAIRYLQVGQPLRQPVTLEIGALRKPFEALDKCVDNLMVSWGIDAERHKTLKQRVMPTVSPSSWVVAQDYPLKMLSAGQPAIVEFRMSVDETGKPTACHIQSTTRPKEFDAAVCGSLMKRARFTPALDAAGKPIASFYRNTVRFALP
jgi:hypothetical protein